MVCIKDTLNLSCQEISRQRSGRAVGNGCMEPQNMSQDKGEYLNILHRSKMANDT